MLIKDLEIGEFYFLPHSYMDYQIFGQINKKMCTFKDIENKPLFYCGTGVNGVPKFLYKGKVITVIFTNLKYLDKYNLNKLTEHKEKQKLKKHRGVVRYFTNKNLKHY